MNKLTLSQIQMKILLFLQMSKRVFLRDLTLLFMLILSACATTPYDYTNFKKYKPKSILVIPPMNRSTDLNATYSCLSSVSSPIAEMGYYVYPVEVIDEMFRQNGMPTAGEMNQAPLKKISEIIRPDAVMYVDIERYGFKYQIVSSGYSVGLNAKLVDAKTGTLLWSGKVYDAESNDSGNSSLAGVLVSAVVSQALVGDERARNLCARATSTMFMQQGRGLLYGPYSPNYNKQR